MTDPNRPFLTLALPETGRDDIAQALGGQRPGPAATAPHAGRAAPAGGLPPRPGVPAAAAQARPAPAGKVVPFLPRGPVFDWASLRGASAAGLPSVDELPHRALTTSGRGAIYQALLQLRLPAGSGVLIPTYHCPTMVAPALLAGLVPHFYGVGEDGLPDLASIDAAVARASRVLLVTHYFGIPHSLHAVRAWCDARRVALIEDCAHTYFGVAGKRPVGAWGDFATASVTKFFPVPESGVLASATRPLRTMPLAPATGVAQLKGLVDVLESAIRHGRLRGMRPVLAALFEIKNRRMAAPAGREAATTGTAGPAAAPDPAGASVDEMMRQCDMGRIDDAPVYVSRLLQRLLPRRRIVEARRRNYALYASHLGDAAGAVPLFELPDGAAPYVYPLRIDSADRADRVYTGLRLQGLPVFRWDRLWPGTPLALAGDVGPLWSRQVLQLLCHQDLGEADVTRTARALLELLSTTGDPAAGRSA